jgi:hypothetical protein
LFAFVNILSMIAAVSRSLISRDRCILWCTVQKSTKLNRIPATWCVEQSCLAQHASKHSHMGINMKIKFAFAALLASLTIAACAPKQEAAPAAPAAPAATEAPAAAPAAPAADAAAPAAAPAADAAASSAPAAK